MFRLDGRLMMLMASKGHFFTQMPQPMHSTSEMNAICIVKGVKSGGMRRQGVGTGFVTEDSDAGGRSKLRRCE